MDCGIKCETELPFGSAATGRLSEDMPRKAYGTLGTLVASLQDDLSSSLG